MIYSDLLEAIAQRLQRWDLLQPVAPGTTAVIPSIAQDRIKYYQSALYGPTEQLDYSITTVRGQSVYPLADTIQGIEQVRMLLVSVWIPMTRADRFWDLLQADTLSPPILTLPSYWTVRGQALRLYPTPNTNYPLELMAYNAVPAPINPGDENFWTTTAATLIIEASCTDISALVLQDQERAMIHQLAVQREMRRLDDLTRRLDGPMRATEYF